MRFARLPISRRKSAWLICLWGLVQGLPTATAQMASPIAPSTGFPVSVVSPDNAAALSINPSALGNIDGWSIAFSHVSAVNQSAYPDRTDAAWLATDLGSMLSLGAGYESLRSRTDGLPDTNSGLLGASLQTGRNWSWGALWHIRGVRADGSRIHSADVAASFRPSSTLAVSLIGRDLAAGESYLGSQQLLQKGVLAFLARPFGDDRFQLELAGMVDERQRTAARVSAQAYVPWVGNLGAAGEWAETDGRDAWTFTAGVDVRWGGISIAPAMHGADNGDLGWSLMVDMHGKPRPGLPAPRYVAKIKVEDLGPRGLLSVVRSLEIALHDPRIKGVLIAPSGAGGGLASAQEVRLLIQELEAADKPVYCHLEAATGSEYYLCAGAGRISIDPAGYLRLMGVSTDALYFGQLLQDAGIRADFVRIGRYKSAPEQYTNRGSSEPAREARTQLLDDAYKRLVYDLAKDRSLSEDQIKRLFDRGPFLPVEAVREKLVDADADAADLAKDAEALYGARALLLDQGKRAAHPRFGPSGQIGVVVIDGSIVDGENVDIPLLDIHMTGGRTIVETIDRMVQNPRIRAIVLRVDSPGGAVMASDQIWRAVQRARKKKPVIASMGEVAASGGYYVASAAQEIWASPSTITGSIGVFYGKVDIAPLANRFGVNIESDKRGAHAGADSLFRPFTDDERATLADKVRLWYRQFLERVSVGRKMPIERVDALARGRVYSGDTAHTLGLVDKLGGLASALARARELASLPFEAELVIAPQRPSTLLDYVLGVGNAKQKGEIPVPAAFKPFLAQLYFLSQVGATTPVALYEGPLSFK
jgi:protease-4